MYSQSENLSKNVLPVQSSLPEAEDSDLNPVIS